ncbi:hypothetical protein ACFQXA_06255 [Nocardiopsis composta]
MGERLSVVFEADPGADERLAGEVLAAAGVEAVEAGGQEGCASLGTVVARRGGELVGWATLLEPDGRDGEPHVQWALASLEAELAAGAAGGGAVGEEELGAVEALVGAAGRRARELGHGGVVWTPSLAEVDEVVAARLGAVVLREEGRDWGVADLSGWSAPAGLPVVRVRRVDEVGEELLEAYARLYADHAVLHPFEQEWDVDDVAGFLDTSHLDGGGCGRRRCSTCWRRAAVWWRSCRCWWMPMVRRRWARWCTTGWTRPGWRRGWRGVWSRWRRAGRRCVR